MKDRTSPPLLSTRHEPTLFFLPPAFYLSRILSLTTSVILVDNNFPFLHLSLLNVPSRLVLSSQHPGIHRVGQSASPPANCPAAFGASVIPDNPLLLPLPFSSYRLRRSVQLYLAFLPSRKLSSSSLPLKPTVASAIPPDLFTLLHNGLQHGRHSELGS